MPWSDLNKWLEMPIIAALLGIHWRGVSKKKQAMEVVVDKAVAGVNNRIDTVESKFVTVKDCAHHIEILTYETKETLRDQIDELKDEIFPQLRRIENAILLLTNDSPREE